MNATNFEHTKVVNSLIKPINEEVKVEFALHPESHHFDRFKAEQFAIASDGKVV